MYDALPPESRTAHAMLILPDKPAEVRGALAVAVATAPGWPLAAVLLLASWWSWSISMAFWWLCIMSLAS